MDGKTAEQTLLLDQLQHIAQGLAETLAPFCEVVVHDFTTPEYTILALPNNLSGRSVGQPATELGLARLADPDYPQVIANYAGRFADGRAVKSTSIGIEDSSGQYVAALCLNVDLTSFQSLTSVLTSFIRVDPARRETLDPVGADAVRAQINAFAARRATSPRALGPQDRRILLQEFRASGHLEVKRSMEIVANHLGLSRAAVYGAAKQAEDRSPT